ncbi:glycosyltransferase family protein [Curtobacterium sp. MR_MD2014]|uniref:glycosyltransferase family protein n=1 Tax=Curtobacterium sp. MR_MD2014 TaxID=1561023 RepID=UPI000AEB2812|nr:glycosyltransferase [Curtobacterium sp. MR_MD2014]
MTRRTLVINPLGGALLHYRSELVSVLRESLQDPLVLEFEEPSVSHESRYRWVSRYIKSLMIARSRQRRAPGSTAIITWPVLGYLDLLLTAVVLPNSWLTVHDPVPLVRAVGYGKLARSAARTLGRHAKIIVLSHQASDEVRRALPRATIRVLPHPILEPDLQRQRPEHTVIRVLGQYKADRDTDLLRSIAAEHPASRCTITGRGWPKVAGWEVDDRFVPEAELDDLIRSASVVLIPYRRFFQSGVAVRCLETGTPFVGPSDSSLSDLLSERLDLLAESSSADWIRAIRAALGVSEHEMTSISAQARGRAAHEWAAM